MTNSSRHLFSLTAVELVNLVSARSILCLPVGSIEQHGSHLPLETDALIAERFTERLVERYSSSYDLWVLPPLRLGFSPEHDWSPGTASLGSRAFLDQVETAVATYSGATSAKSILIVNGHGGNRGLLEACIYDLNRSAQLNLAVIHPTALARLDNPFPLPEIHAGARETSLIMALEPGAVRLELLPEIASVPAAFDSSVRETVLDRGVSWAWNSNDTSLSEGGVIGSDPKLASTEFGELMVESALQSCESILVRLAATDSPI